MTEWKKKEMKLKHFRRSGIQIPNIRDVIRKECFALSATKMQAVYAASRSKFSPINQWWLEVSSTFSSPGLLKVDASVYLGLLWPEQIATFITHLR